jgi:hypothetical protein
MKVLKNIINKSNFIELQKLVFSNTFNWFFVADSAFGGDTKDGINYSFFHTALYEGEINSTCYNFVNPLVLQMKDKFKLNNYKITRLRFGMTTSYGKKVINKPHIDNEKKHKVILLYINNSDGDTYFYKNNKIIKTITPEENKAVLFDGSVFHSSSKPIKNNRRIVLNINLENELQK